MRLFSLVRFLSAVLALLSVPAFAEGHGPALWKVSDADTNLYILGSVHVLKPGTVWLDDGLQQKISSAKAIYLEISAAEQQPQVMQPLMKKYGFLPEGDSLKKHLPEKVYGDLSAALNALGMPANVYDTFKPWTAGIVYETFKFVRAGYNPAAGVEATIVGLAQARGIPVEGLETAESQISLFDALTDQQAADMVAEGLAEQDKLPAIMDRLTKDWTGGDVAGLARYFDEAMQGDPELRQKLIVDRNAAWAPKIKAIMDKPGDYFLAVGAGHLAGGDSVIAMLQKAGMAVKRVN